MSSGGLTPSPISRCTQDMTLELEIEGCREKLILTRVKGVFKGLETVGCLIPLESFRKFTVGVRWS